MALARIVNFEDIKQENIAPIKEGYRGWRRAGGMPPAEVILLHDAEACRAMAIVIVENEDDYRRVDEILCSIPADEAGGRRTSVTKYAVAVQASSR